MRFKRSAKNRLNRFVSKGSEGRRLLENFTSLSLLQVAGYIFPLLTVPYLAHVIGVNYYGEISFAMAIMIYFQTIVDYGFIFSSVRDIARCREDKEQISDIYSKVMNTRFVLVCLSFFLLVVLIILVPKLYGMKWVLLASFLSVIGHAMFPDWMFQGLEKMKFITVFNIIIKLLFTAAVFIFIHKPSDYILQPILSSAGFIICGIAAMIMIHKWGIKLKRVEVSEIKNSLKSNFDLFINQIVPNLYNSASVLLLGFIHGNAANGIYDAGNKFSTAGQNLFSISSRTFYPFLSRRMDKHSFFQKVTLGCAFAVASLLFLFAPFIINTFFPSNFDGALPVLRILSISIFFLSLNNVFGTNWLILKGYEKEMRKITLMSCFAGLLFAIPSVYFWSYIGVAWTVLFSRAVMGILSWLEVLKLKNAKHLQK